MESRPKTIFCDIDGTLVKHEGLLKVSHKGAKLELLPGTLEKFLEWDLKGYKIILTTGRKESLREITENQLKDVGIFYDQLIMGLGGGKRYLINDCKEDGTEYAVAINLPRNKGVDGVDI